MPRGMRFPTDCLVLYIPTCAFQNMIENPWDILYGISGAIEAIPALVVLFWPQCLFPGPTSNNNLGAKWFAAAALLLGGYPCFIVIGDGDHSQTKINVSIVFMAYNLIIGVMTISRLARGMKVDGPMIKLKPWLNIANGILGIALHFTLTAFFVTQIITCSSGTKNIVQATVAAFLAIYLPLFSAFSDNDGPRAAADAAAAPVAVNLPSNIEIIVAHAEAPAAA